MKGEEITPGLDYLIRYSGTEVQKAKVLVVNMELGKVVADYGRSTLYLERFEDVIGPAVLLEPKKRWWQL
jgi:hypothetical protein